MVYNDSLDSWFLLNKGFALKALYPALSRFFVVWQQVRASVLLGLLALTLLAGCLSQDDNSDKPTGISSTDPPTSSKRGETPEGNGSADPATSPPAFFDPFRTVIDLSQCLFMPVSSLIQSADAQAALPSGYRPAPLAPGLVPVNLNLYDCSAVIIDNRTVLHDVRFGYVSIAAYADDKNVSGVGRSEGYIESFFSDNPVLLGLIAGVDIPTHAAIFTIERGSNTSACTVEIEGEAWYSFQGVKSDDLRTNSIAYREHRRSESAAAWADITVTYDYNNLVTEGVLHAQSGVLATASPANSGLHAAISSQGEMTGEIRFGRHLFPMET